MRLAGILAAGLVASLFLSPPASARTLDPGDPDDALQIRKRIACAGVDGETSTFLLSGKVYSRVTGERDRHLFDVIGTGSRRCIAISDPVRGAGFRIINREIVFYTDPDTGEILDRWENPWTGEMVEVLHIANDPVIFDRWPRGRDGAPLAFDFTQMGEWALVQRIVPLFYDNPMGGDYQDYVGNKYHAMEMFSTAALADQLLDTNVAEVYPTTAWTRLSDWMPWMKMSGRLGQITFSAVSARLEGGFDDLPASLKAEILAHHPIYADAPPVDDDRPNDSTWTVVKRHIDEQRAASGEDATPLSGH